jgi:DNA-binding HxlR family transcriptional regulator
VGAPDSTPSAATSATSPRKALRGLERNGLIERTVLTTSPVGVEYSTTPLGHTLKEPFAAMHRWAQAHLADVDAARQQYDHRGRD